MSATGALTNKYAWFATYHGERLHFVPEAGDTDVLWERLVNDRDVPCRLACGRTTLVWPPGIFIRMGERRCSQCCRAAGIPDGYGTPSNWPNEPGYSSPQEGRAA